MREAGLIISSDLCPAALGSSTRLSTSWQSISCNRLGQSVLSFLELDYPSPALAGWRGLKTLSAGVMAPPLAVDPTTTAGDRRGASVELWTRITLNSPQRRASPRNVVLAPRDVKREERFTVKRVAHFLTLASL